MLVIPPAVFNRYILAFDKRGLVQAPMKCGHDLPGVTGRFAVQESNDRHLRLLRPRRERPRGYRAAECGQQFPASNGDCHTPLQREVRSRTIPRHERAVLTARHPGETQTATERRPAPLATKGGG